MRLNKFLIGSLITLIVAPASLADDIFKSAPTESSNASGAFQRTMDRIRSNSNNGSIFQSAGDDVKQRPRESTFEVRPTQKGRDWAATLSQLNQQLVAEPKNANLYGMRAQTYLNLGDKARAMNDIGMAILLDAHNERFYQFRAVLHHDLEQYTLQIDDLSNAIRIGGPTQQSTAELYRSRAGCYELLNNYNEALSDANKAISLDPANAGGYVARAITFVETKEYRKAIADCDKALQLQAENSDAYIVRARAERGCGMLRESQKDIQAGNRFK